MGHLGNPTAFRLGFELIWKFTFFVKPVYYPDFINNLLNIRDYLYYYYTRKKILQGGLCFSHLFIYKYLKNLYINVYIYHIEMEKSSYEMLNILFNNYYSSYNKFKNNYFKNKNKTKKEALLFNNARELSNSDTFVFYYIFLQFFNKGRPNKHKSLLKNNVYITDPNVELYTGALIYNYIIILILYYKYTNFWFKDLIQQVRMCKQRNKAYKNKVYKKKFKIMSYINSIYTKLNKERHIRKHFKLLFKKAKTKRRKKAIRHYMNKVLVYIQAKKGSLKYEELTDFQKKAFEKGEKIKAMCEKRHNLLTFLKIFFKKKKFAYLKKWKLWELKKWRFSERAAVFDNTYLNKTHKFLEDFSLFKKYNAFTILDLFLYFSKKVNFKKYKNSKTLWQKWNAIFKHLTILHAAKLISLKKSYVSSIKNFFFYLNTFIYLSKEGLKKNGIYFNFRAAIYGSVYYGIFSNNYMPVLKMITHNLKTNIALIYTAIKTTLKTDNIFFMYFFISNDTVSSQLISQYIGLRLKRGFLLKSVLKPLRKELIRVSKKGRGFAQKPYIIYNYKLMYQNKKIFLTQIVNKYVKCCYYFIFIKLLKNYIHNGILICFYFFKQLKNKIYKKADKKQEQRQAFFKNFLKHYLYNLFLDKKIKLSRVTMYHNVVWKKYRWVMLLWIKKFYTNIMYRLFLNYDKKSNWDQWNVEKNNDNNKMLIKNAFLNSLKLLSLSLFDKHKKIKKINNMIIVISSFFNKNLFNFSLVKSMWVIYKKINIRNLRQEYKPKFLSGIMGFKLVLKGRFSRRDRASKLVIINGKVPLNVLKNKIDYNLLTIAIKNSAISIRVFIYRTAVVKLYKDILKV